MKIKLFYALLITVSCMLALSVTASSFIFASNLSDKEISDTADVYADSITKATYVPMKVCVEKMNYYRNETLDGSAFTKKFGDIVYVSSSDIGKDVMCIHTLSGNNYVVLGYCRSSSLVKADSLFFAEVPEQWNSEGQISKLVDLRKYIRIFDAKIICDESVTLLIQYDVAVRLFEVAEEIYGKSGYTLCVDLAYIPESEIPEEDMRCCTECMHSTGACLTLSILKKGEQTPISIPVYADPESEAPRQGEISKLLEDYSFIRSGESDCFYDADHDNYISSDLDLSSLIYLIWE